MDYDTFLHKLINVGIEAAREDYGGTPENAELHGRQVRPTTTEKHRADKLVGSIDGFEACRGKQPHEIAELMVDARKKLQEAYVRVSEKEISDGEYWRIRCRQAEIDWVANCVSVILVNQGVMPIAPPTVRAALTVAKIIGVKET
jgi:hypothetical protein